VSTYDGNTSLINNYIIPTIGDTPLNEINIHFIEKYYKELLKMPAVISTRNIKGDKNVTAAAISQIFIPKYVAQYLSEIKAEQDDIIEALGNEYRNYNLIMATTYGLPIGDSYLRGKMQKVIDEQGLPDVVFHSLRHTSITYKLKLSGGDIKSVQGDSGYAQADMVTEVYSHILDEDRRKNAQLIEDAFYNKKNINPDMKEQMGEIKENKYKVTIPEGVDANLLMKVLGNPDYKPC
jgi:putative DNA integration/recombination/invertion protein